MKKIETMCPFLTCFEVIIIVENHRSMDVPPEPSFVVTMFMTLFDVMCTHVCTCLSAIRLGAAAEREDGTCATSALRDARSTAQRTLKF